MIRGYMLRYQYFKVSVCVCVTDVCVMDVTSTNHARLCEKTREDRDVIPLYFDRYRRPTGTLRQPTVNYDGPK